MIASELRLPPLEPLWSHDIDDYVTALTVSHDGALVAAANSSGEVVALEAETGAVAFRIRAHADAVLSASFCPRSPVLATSGQDGRIRLFDGTGAPLLEVKRDAWPEQLAWSPNGERFATACGRVASVWSEHGQLLVESAPQESTITGLGWDRSGSTLAVACYGGVRLFDGSSGSFVRLLPWRGSLISLAWSPDGRIIACATQERAVHFWRLATGKDSEMSGFASKPRALAWDAEGKVLATGGDAVVSLWSFRGKGPESKPPRLLTGHQALCTTLAFHPCRPRLASGSDDTTVLVWSPASGDRPIARASLGETITNLQWARNGRVLIAADAAGCVRAWREPA